METYNNIDEYISHFPKNVQKNLQAIRQTIQKAAPEAKEKISYGIPTFTFHGNLIHFAAYDHHYAVYPGAAGVETFKDQVKDLVTSKGTIQFPIDKPLPLNLIKDITLYRVGQNSVKK